MKTVIKIETTVEVEAPNKHFALALANNVMEESEKLAYTYDDQVFGKMVLVTTGRRCIAKREAKPKK